MIVHGIATKERQKLMRNLRVSFYTPYNVYTQGMYRRTCILLKPWIWSDFLCLLRLMTCSLIYS